MLRRFLPIAFAVACEHAEAPTELGYTGTCKLAVPENVPGFVHVRTPNEAKTHVVLEISHGMLARMHVDLPDGRAASLSEVVPDDPLLSGDARPNVPLDPETDVDVPISLTRAGAESPWDLEVRVRFHVGTADAVVGRMHVTGECVPAKSAE